MVFNLFKRDKHDDNNEDDQLLQRRIDEALQQAESDYKKVQKAIAEVESMAAEAIIDAYIDVFPNGNLSLYRDKYKETALKDYIKIREEYDSKIDPSTVKQCEQVVLGYLKRAEELRENTKRSEKLIEEYKATKAKYEAVKRRNAKQDKLDQHGSHLSSVDDTSLLASAIEGDYKLDDIQDEVAMKEEYLKQLEQVNREYGDSSSYVTDISADKAELDRLIKGLDEKSELQRMLNKGDD